MNLRINILGGGPAGLYAAILLKRARPGAQITLFEQNPANATFGFGVVFSDQALDFLRAEDRATADLIEPRMIRWSDIIVNHRGTRIAIDGIGFAAIGRLELLQLLHSILYPPCRQARYRALRDLAPQFTASLQARGVDLDGG